jgi:hypothetical protein
MHSFRFTCELTEALVLLTEDPLMFAHRDKQAWRLRARAAFSSAESFRAAARTRTARSSGDNVPAGSTSRSKRTRMADRAASA